jgi:hypothetical protein
MSDVIAEWVRCRAWLLAALEHTTDRFNEDDIVKGILVGEYQFWPGPDAAIVTQIAVYPRRRVSLGFLAGGNLNTVRRMERDIAAKAKAAGIEQIEIVGRRGWLRALDGYEERFTMATRNL